jgi:hypothetical protein
MIKIARQYLNEALRIRKEYINHLKMIEEKNSILVKSKNDIQLVVMDTEKSIKDMEDYNEKMTLISEKLQEIEKSMTIVENEIKPHSEAIDVLREDSEKLLNSIVEKYPDLSTDEIKTQIYNFLVAYEE